MDLVLLQALLAGGGLLVVVVVSEVARPRRRPERRQRRDWSYGDGPLASPPDLGHGHGYAPPAVDEELHRKIDALASGLNRRASLWTKFGWGAIGFALTFAAEHFLSWWFQIC